MDTPTFGRFIFDWLLEGSDVTEGAKKQDDLVLLVPDWSDLHEEPNRHPCVEEIADLSGDQRNAPWVTTFLSDVGWETSKRKNKAPSSESELSTAGPTNKPSGARPGSLKLPGRF